MDLKDVKNKVSRNGFDLSFRNLFTAKAGEILPVMCKEILPGDKVKCSMQNFLRTLPLQTASFARVRQYYDFYFVPYRLLWRDFPQWIVKTQQPERSATVGRAVELTNQGPYLMASDVKSILSASSSSVSSTDVVGMSRINQSKKLLNYLGYNNLSGSEMASFQLNPYPLLAYQKIYSDYYRFQEWEKPNPLCYNVDFVSGGTYNVLGSRSGSSASSLMTDDTMFTLRYANYDKDLINGILPQAQFGDPAIAGPISGNLQGALSRALISNTAVSGDLGVNGGGSETTTSANGVVYNSNSQLSLSGSSIFGVNTSGIAVTLIRQAQALQKWKEITISGNLDYVAQIKRHWNVNVDDALSNKCLYLGGIGTNVDVNEMANTNLSTSSAQPNLKGKGVSVGKNAIEFKAQEHGLLICCFHIKPIIDWFSSNRLERMMTRTVADSYPIPEFDKIGMESVYLYEVHKPTSIQSSLLPLGYAPRYYDYKTSLDQVHGAFETSGLSPWIITSYQDSQELSSTEYARFKVNPRDTNSFTFAQVKTTDDVSSDNFLNAVYFDLKVVRNLDRNGLPY